MVDQPEQKDKALNVHRNSGTAKLSLSHGRSKQVVVETRKKRVITRPNSSTFSKGGPGASGSMSGRSPQEMAELERRRKAVELAKVHEADHVREARERREKHEAELVKMRAQQQIAQEEAQPPVLAPSESEVMAKDETPAPQKSEPKPAAEFVRTKEPATASPARPQNFKKKEDERFGATAQPERNERPNKTPDMKRRGKITIGQALNDEPGGRQRSVASMRRRLEREKRRGLENNASREKIYRDVQVPDAITVQELANRMAERVADLVKMLMQNGIMVTQNQTIDADTAVLLVEEFGHKVIRVSASDVEDSLLTKQDQESDLAPRPPIITIMGHVDHGKTSLLDAIRKTNVVAGEAGGITQHIGAYRVQTSDGAILTFLDTPGHEAFTSMRERGAHVTDIVVLVVAADDGVMPQTVEAISHAKAAKVPLIVAINKIDREGADPLRVRTELLQHEIVVESLSGDVLDIEVSAHTGQGLDKLLESIALQAEILELRANANREAMGAVIEAKLDVGRGPVATVLVQNGTLNTGDIFVVGEQWGRVRALINDQGEQVKSAGPSVPVEVLGLQGTPEAGDVLNVVPSEARAREVADYRQKLARDKRAALGSAKTLDQLLAQKKANEDISELTVIVKVDVQGSAEAIVQALEKIGNDEVRVRAIHSGVGAITESDVTLAAASGSALVGFNVRANAMARNAAQQKGIEIRYYSIIYNLIDDIKAVASGMLSPEVRENFIGYAKIKQVFKVSNVGKVAGCEVTEGVARRHAGVRLLRDNVVIHEGKLKTLKRFHDEVKEAKSGQECGMAFENYEDIREGDVIEIYTTEEIERAL